MGPGDLQKNSNVFLKIGPDGVRLEVSEVNDGKEEKQVYEAGSVEEFRQKYPEVAERFGIQERGGMGFQFRIGQEPRGPRSPGFRFFGPETRIQEGSPPAGDRLGVEIDSVGEALADYLDLDDGIGLLVRGVEKRSLAERMGIQSKDVLLRINGNEVRGRDTILETLRGTPAGGEVIVDVLRAGSGRLTLRGKKLTGDEKPSKPLEKSKEPK